MSAARPAGLSQDTRGEESHEESSVSCWASARSSPRPLRSRPHSRRRRHDRLQRHARPGHVPAGRRPAGRRLHERRPRDDPWWPVRRAGRDARARQRGQPRPHRHDHGRRARDERDDRRDPLQHDQRRRQHSGRVRPFGGPFDVTFNTVEDSTINGGYTESGYDGFWNGFFRNNVHGSVNFYNNVVLDPDGNEFQTNTIHGNLNCFGNDPAPQSGDSGGEPNHVTGRETGQCVGL